MPRSRWVPCLLAASLWAANARGEENAYQDSANPVLTRVPRVGELMLHTGQGAVYQAAEGWTGVWTVGATWGLPHIDYLAPLKLRLELPILEQRPGVRAGSLLGTIGSTRTLAQAGPVMLGASFEIGAVAPSFGGTTLEVAGNALAERHAQLYYGASIPVTLRPLGLGIVFWSTPFASVNFEVDYAAPDRALVLRAGAGLPVGDQPARWFGGAGMRLAPYVELGLSASTAIDDSKGALLEMSARWSPPTEATRTVPWADADARVLHAEELRGRSIETLGAPGKFTIIEFDAEWCEPCRRARPVLEELARRSRAAVRLIDVDECPEFAARHNVKNLPTFIVLDPSGIVVRHLYGFDAKILEDIVPP